MTKLMMVQPDFSSAEIEMFFHGYHKTSQGYKLVMFFSMSNCLPRFHALKYTISVIKEDTATHGRWTSPTPATIVNEPCAGLYVVRMIDGLWNQSLLSTSQASLLSEAFNRMEMGNSLECINALVSVGLHLFFLWWFLFLLWLLFFFCVVLIPD